MLLGQKALLSLSINQEFWIDTAAVDTLDRSCSYYAPRSGSAGIATLRHVVLHGRLARGADEGNLMGLMDDLPFSCTLHNSLATFSSQLAYIPATSFPFSLDIFQCSAVTTARLASIVVDGVSLVHISRHSKRTKLLGSWPV
jgi:hypothetical protein